ncbi:MAG: DUF3821 domain-containing protein, partial [Methanoregula sp.]|nr:DUF3821 domain-containing protein [Methanoregula sp.]
MTKRLTITLVALALFVLLAVLPVSAVRPNGTVIEAGAQVYIGEEGLNITHALNLVGSALTLDELPTYTRLGWWASAADITITPPSRIVDTLNRNNNFMVTPAEFVGYTGNWYLLGAGNIIISPLAVITVQDPTLDIRVWDFGQATDVTGKSVPQGSRLGFRIDTNMAGALDTSLALSGLRMRNNVIDLTNVYIYGAPATGIAGTNMATGSVDGVWSNATAPAPENVVVTYTNYTSLGFLTTWSTPYTDTKFSQVCYYCATYSTASVTNYNNFTVDALYSAPGCAPLGVPITGLVLYPAAGYNEVPNPDAKDGFITIKVKPESGTTLQYLYNDSAITGNAGPNYLLKQFVNTQPFFWGSDTPAAIGYFRWATAAIDTTGQYAYPAGTYTVTAESALNKMKDNYKNAGADYTGKTVTEARTVTLVSDTVKIVTNKDSVVRSKPFSVTVTGRPSTDYWVWVKNTRSMTGGYDDQAPLVTLYQEKVFTDLDVPGGVVVHTNGQFYPENRNYLVWEDVSQYLNATRHYAKITTSTSGTRTIEFETTNWTKAQTYTIRVERKDGDEYKSDEVDVKVEKGAVTITAAGDQSYYLGEEIKFSGTNTESYWTYLFIVGPNLWEYGANIRTDDPRNNRVIDQNE